MAEPKCNIEYITTAIVYPNNRIHIGWAWECIGSDWLARGLTAFGLQTYFATGMDEHSLNVQKAAEAKNLAPQTYCDQMAVDIQKSLRAMGMSYDKFIRTSDSDHKWVVSQLVQRAFDNGDIYKAKYEGFYCEGCEAFYTEKDLVDGKCPEHKTAPKWISEENYFFKLSKYQDQLLKLFKDQPDFLLPDYRRTEIVNFVQAGLKDFSISRSGFTWGIPLPFDPKQVVYVWFDALINYLTAAGMEFKLKDSSSDAAKEFDARWPARVHVIGKGVTRFHTVYWPAMLISMGIPLPKQVFAHGYINFKGERMSKSSGNYVTPDEVIETFGADQLRYYLLAENNFSQDGNFAWDAMVLKVNADLANDFGNLVNRSISMCRKYFPDEEMRLPSKLSHSQEVQASFEKLPAELRSALDRMDPQGYILAIRERTRLLNLYIDKTKPWALAKNEAQREELREVIATLLEGIHWVATAFAPVLPFGMPEVFKQIGRVTSTSGKSEEPSLLSEFSWCKSAFKVGEPKPVYPRLELPVALGGVAKT
jgi:methionyl-tRNA synthetase